MLTLKQLNSVLARVPASLNPMQLKTAVWLLLAFVLLGSMPIWAQSTGAIVGTVADPSGAIIPGAKVTATNVATSVSQSTVTTGAGTYTIPNLVVGTYNITAEGQGFKSGNATGITLDVSINCKMGWSLGLFFLKDGGLGMPCGSSGVTAAMAVCTSTVALSMSRSKSNCSVICVLPVPLCEVISFTPAMVVN